MTISVKHTDPAGRVIKKRMRKPKIWRGKSDTQALVSILHADTLAGVAAGTDVTGRAFAPYSKDYAERTGKVRVNLRSSGAMIEGLKLKSRAVSGDVVAGTPRVALHHFGSPKQGIPARPWFGIRTKTADDALKEADRRVEANLRSDFTGKAATSALTASTGSTRGVL